MPPRADRPAEKPLFSISAPPKPKPSSMAETVLSETMLPPPPWPPCRSTLAPPLVSPSWPMSTPKTAWKMMSRRPTTPMIQNSSSVKLSSVAMARRLTAQG